MSRNIYFEVDYSSSPTLTRIFSIVPDEIGEGRLLAPLKLSVRVRTWAHSDKSETLISKVLLANADGELDDFEDEDFGDCRIKESIDGVITTVAVGQVKRGLLGDNKIMEMHLRDPRKPLEVPLQPSEYPASEDSDSDVLVTNTYYAMESHLRPVCFGWCWSVPGVLVNRSINEYHVHDEAFVDVTSVYDRGVDVIYTTHTTSFTLSKDPDGSVVADVKGQSDGNSPADYIREPRECFEYILDKIGYTNFDTDSLDDLEPKSGAHGANYTPLLGYYQDNDSAMLAADVMQWMCDSFTGWYYTAPDGELKFGYLKEPESTADVSLDESNISGGINIFNDTAPNLKTRVGAARNWYVYDEDQVAPGASESDRINLSSAHRKIRESSTAVHPFYPSTSEVHDTLLRGSGNAASESDNICNLWAVKRKFYNLDSDTGADIGQTVKVTHPRYGLDSGVNLLCLGYELELILNSYRLTLWG